VPTRKQPGKSPIRAVKRGPENDYGKEPEDTRIHRKYLERLLERVESRKHQEYHGWIKRKSERKSGEKKG